MDRSAHEKGKAMAYVKPRGFTRRVVNPLVSRLHSGGVEPRFRDLPDPADHPVFVIEREELAP